MVTTQFVVQVIAIFGGVIVGVLISKFLDHKIQNNQNLYFFHVTCICVNSKGKRIYKSYTTQFCHLYPTEGEIEKLKESILDSNPGYKECSILSYIRLGVDNGCNQDS